MSLLEISANLFTVICIFLAGRNNVLSWPVGIIACFLFGLLFYNANLYADVTLQIFFVATGIYGWYIWKIKKNKIEPIKDINLKYFILYILLAIFCATAYGLILKLYTNAFAPFIDSMVLSFSILAQLLLMKRYINNWYVWVLVNTLSVPLYISRELYLTAFLYGIFWLHAWYALYFWKKEKVKQNEQ